MAQRVSAGQKLVGAVVVAVLGLGVGGCALKGGQNVSLVTGKVLFVKDCASCHTLARASANGVIGPNLDVAFAASLSQGLGRDVIGPIVEQQIEYPSAGGVMPKLPLSTRQAADIATYVQYASARAGKDTGLLASAVNSGVGPPAIEKNGKLAFTANPSGQLLYTVKAASASAGAVTITMTNASGVPHNVAIQQGTSGPVLKNTNIAATGTQQISVNLKAGSYTFFCQVTGHRASGMFGTLTVK